MVLFVLGLLQLSEPMYYIGTYIIIMLSFKIFGRSLVRRYIALCNNTIKDIDKDVHRNI